MSLETLYLVLECRRPYRHLVRISKVSKRRPILPRPSEQALLKLQINIPDTIMEPRAVTVHIKAEDIVTPVVTVAAVKP